MVLKPDETTRYRLRGAPIIHDTIDNETIAINQRTGAYYSIEGPGAQVWQLLEGGATAAQITRRLCDSFSGDLGVIEAAVRAFLDEMATEELIVVDDRASDEREPSPRPPAGELPAFPGLRLQRYNDLEVMLLADPIHEVDDTGWPMPLADTRE